MSETVNILIEEKQENVVIAIETVEGEPGVKGDKGDKGDQGDQGDPAEQLVTSVNGQQGVVVLDADDISDSATTNKFVTATEKSNIHASGSDAETATSIGALINGATAKDTPVDADMIALMDSEATNLLKKFSWANIKAKLKDYFDTIYAAASHTHSYLSALSGDSTPTLAGNLVLNGKCIDYGAILSTNGAYQGDIMTVTVDTNGVGFGALLAQGADFHFDEADADAAANCQVLVMALETGTGSKKVLLKGEICNTDWNWSAGFIYASTTQGELTQTPPSGTDDVKVIVGWSLSADTIFFTPYLYYQELS